MWISSFQLNITVLVLCGVLAVWAYDKTPNENNDAKTFFKSATNERVLRSTTNQRRVPISTGNQQHGMRISKRYADLSINQDLQVLADMLFKDRQTRLKNKYVNLRSQLRKLGKRDVMSVMSLKGIMHRGKDFKNIRSQMRILGKDDVESRTLAPNKSARFQPEVSVKGTKPFGGMKSAPTPPKMLVKGLQLGKERVQPMQMNESGILTVFVKYAKLIQELREMLEIERKHYKYTDFNK